MGRKQGSGGSKARNRFARCAYCGVEGQMEREHVIPRCLFVKQPDNHVFVPACSDCNRDKSRYDADLRDSTATDLYSSSHTVAQQLVSGKIRRAVRNNRGMFPRALEKREYKRIYSRCGVALFDAVEMPIDRSHMERALEYILRGLYFHIEKRLLPGDTVIEVRRNYHDSYARINSALSDGVMNGHVSVGDVFLGFYGIASDVEHSGVFIMRFFGAVFTIYFGRPNCMRELALEMELKS